MQDTIEGFRLSPQQERLWLLQQDNDAYRAHCSILLKGTVNVETLKAAVSKVICRNEIYRTSFHRLPGLKIPIQVIEEKGLFTWQHIELSRHSPQEQEARVAEFSREQKQRPIDFQDGPLVHFSLITLSDQRHVLLVHLLSLLADNRTLQNLVGEIARFYRAEPVSDGLSDEVVQYIQFSEWQNTLLEEEEGTIGREYWRKKDISAPSSWFLPFESRPGKEAGFVPDRFALPVDPVIQAKLEAAVKKENTTTAIFLLACWQVLLWRLTEQGEFLIGMGTDGRIYEELAEAAGLFAKHLLVRGHETLVRSPRIDLWDLCTRRKFLRIRGGALEPYALRPAGCRGRGHRRPGLVGLGWNRRQRRNGRSHLPGLSLLRQGRATAPDLGNGSPSRGEAARRRKVGRRPAALRAAHRRPGHRRCRRSAGRLRRRQHRRLSQRGHRGGARTHPGPAGGAGRQPHGEAPRHHHLLRRPGPESGRPRRDLFHSPRPPRRQRPEGGP